MAKQPPQGEPPNLRNAEDEVRCGSCAHFDMNKGGCTRFDFAVTEDQVCDAWEAAGEEEEMEPAEPMPGPGGPPPMMPGMEG